MPRIQVIPITSERHFKHCLSYPTDITKCKNRMYGMTNAYCDRGFSPSKTILKNIKEVYGFHGISSIKRKAFHIILTFSDSERMFLTKEIVLQMGYFLAMSEFPNNQCFFGVHDHGNKLHLDFLLFPVDIYTGCTYSCSKSGWYKILNDLIQFMEAYIPKEKITTMPVIFGQT